MDFEKLDAVAQRLMQRRKAHPDREIGSVYEHGRRVARLTQALRLEICPEDASMDDVLRLAGMFHDVGKGIEPHASYGALIMQQAVRGIVSDADAAEAARLISAHCDRRPEDPDHDIPTRILQDADLLDHVGTYTIWMDVQHCASHDESFSTLARRMADEADHYAQTFRPLLNFPVSKAIYDDRIAFYLEFAQRIQTEAEGLLK